MKNVHKDVLSQILNAPMNLFFDVTPIGKIMRIFTEDLNVFYGRILDSPKGIMELLISIFVSLSIMFSIGNYEYVIPTILVMFMIMY